VTDAEQKEKAPEKSSAAFEKEETPTKKRGRKASTTKKTASKSKETVNDVVKMEERPKEKAKAADKEKSAPSNDSDEGKTRSSKPAKKGWWQRLTDG